MSQENVEIVRQLFEALSRRDWDAIQKFLAPDAEVHDFDIPDAGVYRGPTAIQDWLGGFDIAWETWGAEELEVRAAPDERVVAQFTLVAKGRGSGLELRRRDAVLYTLRGDKVSRVEYYNENQKDPVLAAAGLSELDR